jgi:hypothetical protein
VPRGAIFRVSRPAVLSKARPCGSTSSADKARARGPREGERANFSVGARDREIYLGHVHRSDFALKLTALVEYFLALLKYRDIRVNGK